MIFYVSCVLSLGYLQSDWKKAKAFVNALAKFHFRTFRIGEEIYNLFSGISGVVDGDKLHNSHLIQKNLILMLLK
ncbi:hypothetical protein A9G45_05285 [Gilliamella sp. HK2]|jgi:hypothetical protein|nr:hypothetical protein A9G46_09635 [Gilliamella apicola]OCG28956.1 hypothetical protein A9G45_05285 [Gilliamella apicola]